jgi:hypothetical protein
MAHTTTRQKGASLILEIEADTLEDARAEIAAQMPRGFALKSEAIVSSGTPETTEARAETADEAFKKAERAIPRNAKILERAVVSEPQMRVSMVDGFDVDAAKAQASDALAADETIKNVSLASTGRKGVFGIGRTPNQYEVRIARQAHVRITHRQKVRLDAEIAFHPLGAAEWSDVLSGLAVTRAESDFRDELGGGETYSSTTCLDVEVIVKRLLSAQGEKGVTVSIQDEFVELQETRRGRDVTTRYHRVGDGVWQDRQHSI